MHLLLLILATVQADKPKADPPAGADAAVAAALRNHPDVRVAEANRLLAEAELEQTKLAVTKRVSAAYAKSEAAKLKYEANAKVGQLVKMGTVAQTEALRYTVAEAEARAEMIVADEEVKAAVGSAKGPGTAAEGVALALKQHPDIRVAEARVAVAAAMLDQARLAVTQRVGPAFARIQAAKVKVATAEDDIQRVAGMVKKGFAPKSESDRVEAAVQTAKAELAAAEAELKAVTGGGEKDEGDKAAATLARALRYQLRASQIADPPSAPTGTVADKLRAVIDKPIKMGVGKQNIGSALDQLLDTASVKGVTVRGTALFHPDGGIKDELIPKVKAFTGEQTFAAWAQMMIDDLNESARNQGGNLVEQLKGKHDLYVREYGLALMKVDAAPKDALTLTEFARLVRAEKDEPAEPKK